MVSYTPAFLYRCALTLALIVVTALALTPVPELPLALWDKANHALAYLFLAFLADHGFPQKHGQTPHKTAFLGLFFYGVLIEGLQSQIPYRQASALDLIANTTGLALYTMIYMANRRLNPHA